MLWKYVLPRIRTVIGAVLPVRETARTAPCARVSVGNGPSVPSIVGSANVPDHESSPFVATMKSAAASAESASSFASAEGSFEVPRHATSTKLTNRARRRDPRMRVSIACCRHSESPVGRVRRCIPADRLCPGKATLTCDHEVAGFPDTTADRRSASCFTVRC